MDRAAGFYPVGREFESLRGRPDCFTHFEFRKVLREHSSGVKRRSFLACDDADADGNDDSELKRTKAAQQKACRAARRRVQRVSLDARRRRRQRPEQSRRSASRRGDQQQVADQLMRPRHTIGQNVRLCAMVSAMPGHAYDKLFELATGQHGYVTQEQALELGLSPDTLGKMAKRGNAVRTAYGLYRFRAYPHGPYDDYMEAVLWPHGLEGVLSHETALDLYGLSDVNPTKIHLTLPAGFRVTRAVPKLYALHFEDLEEDEVTYREGIRVTTVVRAIRDCHRDHLRRSLLDQAMNQARALGLITAAQERELRREIARPIGAMT